MSKRKNKPRPDRNPNLILPASNGFKEIHIWMEEKIFELPDTNFIDNYIYMRQDANKIKYQDPVKFIDALLAHNKTDETLRQIILDYYAEQALLG